ncbi:amidohydrolase [Paenibacillus albiflavus]|uniref:Amidohydrolase n=1 Tax=Paenibacillus albiflavus TaxID=2545760 RepID=A0A4R4EJ61_9BACL|nr:M20 family metallopeptidase [Paenibacillus albiflavus]TCZ79443.1 amidohydrolase [Paenibacillus albiflavus]
MLRDKLYAQLEEMYDEMVGWRRHLHQYPELSFMEKATPVFIADKLRSYGYEVREHVGGNGVVAKISGGKTSGITVALRADMDALPIQDLKSCEYASTVPGVMHACGHDGHTSSLLAIAKVLADQKEQLPGNFVLIFQHAEEISPGGANPMIQDGVLDGVDAIYGVHLWSLLPYGTISSRSGAIMAASDEFKIEVNGKGGHGGLPHQTVDAVVVSSHIVVNLQSIVSRNVDPTESCVISVGTINGGTGFNVIAESTSMIGTVRTFHPDVLELVSTRMEEVIAGTCKMFHADYRFEYNRGYPPVINHAGEAERFKRVGQQVVDQAQVLESPQMMAGEDFAYYLQQVPGCFMFVGAGNEEQGIVYPHHHPRFDFDERAMLNGAKLLLAMALDRMQVIA